MALGGIDNLLQALELYHQVLAIRESLADTLQTTEAYADLAVCLFKTAQHPLTSRSDKKAMLARSLKLSKELYEKTNLDIYQSYIEECEALLRSC